MKAAECVIVGGGPAGLAAARTAARHGVRVVLIDDHRELGGRSLRQMPAAHRPASHRSGSRESQAGRPLIEAVTTLGVELRLGAVAWDVFDQRTVALATDTRTDRISAGTLILAPGAYDRPVPFPGWTLPGVMTAGGASILMGAYGVLPGRRVLVAGSGPRLLRVAHALIGGGATVAAVCEASPMRHRWRFSHRLLPHLDFVQQRHQYRREMREAGVPFLTGHVIRRALGEGAVTGAVVSRCDGEWRPLGGTERHLEVDAVVVGYGDVPSLELSRLAGCEHRYVPEVGGHAPIRTRDMETTVANVFAVGDVAGSAGSAVALEEGYLAGLVVAHRLGRLEGREYSRGAGRARGRLLHLAGLRRAVDDLYRFGPGIYSLADSGTTLCRCEEVSAQEALAAAREGAIHVDEVKARTRIGMGRCQGRLCGPALAHVIARAAGISVAAAGIFTPRAPVRPVALAALASESR